MECFLNKSDIRSQNKFKIYTLTRKNKHFSIETDYVESIIRKSRSPKFHQIGIKLKFCH